MSRVLQVRNPGLGDRFDEGFASHGDLFAALVRVREEQGGDMSDYFYLPEEEKAEGEEK